MKRIILSVIAIISFWGSVNAQTYYNMWSGGGFGGLDWVANLGMRTKNVVGGTLRHPTNVGDLLINMVNGAFWPLKPRRFP